ncbi:uncharacterized protein Dwil_GK22012 [Drosophila willistoni]|uniref:Phospholipase A2 n=2 Tax=Drosophila willistoni TaxID=7260 RepID=B4MR68_DROWI|nr:uncharacterized protein Dwil_GK22012 [Drosophila willistoni]
MCSLSHARSAGITVPGTNWCGPGNIARNYNDLGSHVELDKCCRAHDNCKEKILAQDSGYGLHNYGLFPIFSCTCEEAFRKCLTSLHSTESAALGRIYFGTTESCFAYGHPIVECLEKQWDISFQKRCLSYRVDETKPKVWQLNDLAFYTYVSESTEQ